jgi:hypothetical protein
MRNGTTGSAHFARRRHPVYGHRPRRRPQAPTVSAVRTRVTRAGRRRRTPWSQRSRFDTYATPAGRTLIDRELYLPQSWTDDRSMCAPTRSSIGSPRRPGPRSRSAPARRRPVNCQEPYWWAAPDQPRRRHGPTTRSANRYLRTFSVAGRSVTPWLPGTPAVVTAAPRQRSTPRAHHASSHSNPRVPGRRSRGTRKGERPCPQTGPQIALGPSAPTPRARTPLIWTSPGR